MYDVVVQRSSSLSHLLMSSCISNDREGSINTPNHLIFDMFRVVFCYLPMFKCKLSHKWLCQFT